MTPKALKTIGAAALALLPFGASAQGIDDPSRAAYFDEFKGKTIAFVPASMGIDLTEGWAKMMKREADKLGMNFIIRDAQWSSDVGSQAITSLIGEKPDVMVVHNPDVQSYARLFEKGRKGRHQGASGQYEIFL